MVIVVEVAVVVIVVVVVVVNNSSGSSSSSGSNRDSIKSSSGGNIKIFREDSFRSEGSLGVEFVDHIGNERRSDLLLQQFVKVDGFEESCAHDIPAFQ